MKTHNFAVIASGVDQADENSESRFSKAGCGDATISFHKGLLILQFSRQAENFAHAIISAFEDVHKAGARVERFEPDCLVSLSEIAERTGMSKAAISLYWKGERGTGFPAPKIRITSESPLWDWVDVSQWMHANAKLSRDAVQEAHLLKEANILVRLELVPRDSFAKQIRQVAAQVA